MSRQEKRRASTLEEIKAFARQQMAENGTAAISLSAIARAMEISAPALYRYYASRDDLVTALIVDSYSDLAATLEACDVTQPAEAYGVRLMAVIQAYREWALDHPVDFELIYGNPIPGYHAPEQLTTPAARRGFAVILRILAEARQAGVLRPLPEHLHLPQGLQVALPQIEGEEGAELPADVVYLGVVGWTRIHGMIMLELFHHTRSLVSDTGAFYRHEVASLLHSVGLQVG